MTSPLKLRLFLGFSALIAPAILHANVNDMQISEYMAARLAEIANANTKANTGYIKLLAKSPANPILAERLFVSAVYGGDMQAAVRASRLLELKNRASAENAMLLFADAFTRKNWAMADVAAKEVGTSRQFAFLKPIYQVLLAKAQGKTATFDEAQLAADKTLNYYAVDQKVYLNILNKEYSAAKEYITGIQDVDGYDSEIVAIETARALAHAGYLEDAKSVVRGILESEVTNKLAPGAMKSTPPVTPQSALAALHARISMDLLDQGISEQALIHARLADWLSPASDFTAKPLASALQATGQDEKAKLILSSVPFASPYWLGSVTARATMLQEIGRKSDALVLLANSRQKMPGSLSLAIQEAAALEASGNFAAASAAYKFLVSQAEKASAPVERIANLQLVYATVLDKSGKWTEARDILQKATTNDGGNPYILNYLGYSMLEHGEDSAKALKMLQKAYDLAPQSMAIADSLGWAHFHNGDLAKAIPLLETAAKASGSDMTIYDHLGDAYWYAGRRIDARYAWAAAEHGSVDAEKPRLRQKQEYGPKSEPVRSN
jgi:tetratricopeptide (TPR) repeat protein